MSDIKAEADVNDSGIILIDGATGYVGSHLTDYLSRQGLAVRCLARTQADPEDIAVLKSCKADVHQADSKDDSAKFKRAFQGIRTAVHLIGSIAPRKGESLEELHVGETRRFAELCLDAQVTRVIMVTALGTGKNALSEYHRTKWLAEEVVRASGLNCIFIRPSLLIGRTFGRRDSKLVRRFREMIAKRRVVPLIGGGANKIQPLFIGDLVAAIAKCLVLEPADAFDSAPIFELGGPQVMTMRQFVEELMNVLGYTRKFFDLPVPLANLLGFFAEISQDVPIVSRDQIKISMIDNICATNDLTGKLGIEPVNVSFALRTYTKTMGDQSLLLGRV
jgi:NADH dehydrogenase